MSMRTATGPIIELGPGTGPVTDALIQKGVDPSRLVLVEFDTHFCRLLQARYPQATVVQGDAYSLRQAARTICWCSPRRRSCPACR